MKNPTQRSRSAQRAADGRAKDAFPVSDPDLDRDLGENTRTALRHRVRATGPRFPACGAWLTAVVGCFVISACSLPLPQATEDPTRFYVLSVPSAGAGVAVPAANAPAIRLRPIELASYLRARPMVVRRGANELEFREFARWGEPLEQGIARVLGEELLARGAVSTVQSGARPGEMGDVRYEVTVRVLACEGVADGSVNFHAAWDIRSTGDNPGPVTRGDYRAVDVRWTPHTPATLAAALSRAVAGLAGDIAAGLAKRQN